MILLPDHHPNPILLPSCLTPRPTRYSQTQWRQAHAWKGVRAPVICFPLSCLKGSAPQRTAVADGIKPTSFYRLWVSASLWQFAAWRLHSSCDCMRTSIVNHPGFQELQPVNCHGHCDRWLRLLVQGDQGGLPMQTQADPNQHPRGIGLIPRSMCGSSRNDSGAAHPPPQRPAYHPAPPQVAPGYESCSTFGRA